MSDKLNITELDYQNIKDNLISYFQGLTDANGNRIYQDYDFSGSALNTLIGILAYNTHYNAMMAHMAVNETFIDSAQLRSSVVSAAKLLGYTPRSFSSASTLVTLSIPCKNPSTNPSTIFLDKNIILKNFWNNENFYYVFKDGVVLRKNGAVYTSSAPVQIVEGQRVVKRFQVNGSDDYEKYVIDDENIDVSSLIVRVYQNGSDSSNVEVYSNYYDLSQTDPSAQLYYLSENTLGRYEISFGNDIISKKLKPLNVIEVEYIVTNGVIANGSPGPFSVISSNDDLQNYTSGTLSITPLGITSGGSDRESVESVRSSATSSFITQNRAVTADDYESIIKKYFADADSVSVWGGEDNVPPQYGKVFISVKKASSLNGEEQLTQFDKETIHNILRGKKVLSIMPEIVDAEYINIVLDVLFKYNSNILSVSKSSLENQIRNNVIRSYNDNVLNGFGKIFRHSHFTKTVDNYSSAILNSHVRVYLSKTFEVNPLSYTDLIINYGAELTTDDGKAVSNYIVTEIEGDSLSSAVWTYNDVQVYLADREHPSNKNIRILYTYQILANGVTQKVINDNVGKIYLKEGRLELIQRYISDAKFKLTLDLIPISDDIVSRRNQLVTIDYSRCNVQGDVDTIAVGGSSRAINYETFKRDR